jgi:hypothetical protein
MKKMFFDILLSKLFYKEKVHKFQKIYGKMFFDVLLSKLFYKEKVHKFQQIYGKMGGVVNGEQRSRSRSRRGGGLGKPNRGCGRGETFFPDSGSDRDSDETFQISRNLGLEHVEFVCLDSQLCLKDVFPFFFSHFIRLWLQS